MASKGGLDRKASETGEARRILILDQSKCKPGMEAHDFMKRMARNCPTGRECVNIDEKKVVTISEDSCAACLNKAKQCPGDAVRIVNLPQNLQTDVTHKYGMNAFKLHGLPTPRPGTVLGLLGTNGIGKSTALNVLSGRLKPNLGRPKEPPDWHEILAYYRGSELQKYFTRMLEDDLRVAIKVQLDTDYVRSLAGKTVGAVLKERDERDVWEEMAAGLDLTHLLDREVQALSGGELQRFAIASTAIRDADVYMFDEASSFLDIKQRMTATEVIRKLVFGKDDGAGASKYVLVVEHDLAVLDYMSDYICCLYGEPGAYGVVTKIASVRNGINNFLAGYIPAENMRFRAEELTFHVSGAEAADQIAAEGAIGRSKLGTVTWPGMSKTLTNEAGSNFTLHVKPGQFRGGEIVGLLGENGCGKTTFMELLAGHFDEERQGDKKKPAAAPVLPPAFSPMACPSPLSTGEPDEPPEVDDAECM